MPERMMTAEHAVELVAEAAEEVLETMFFAMVVDPEEVPEPGQEPCLGARVRFEGAPSGAIELSLDRPAAVSIAATFLCIDEEESLTPEQVNRVWEASSSPDDRIFVGFQSSETTDFVIIHDCGPVESLRPALLGIAEFLVVTVGWSGANDSQPI